jgi:arylsulfatase A-like enzyme
MLPGTSDLETHWRERSLRRSLAALFLVSLLPAACDAIVSLVVASRHLAYYMDAATAGALIVALGGLLLGAAGLAALRLMRGGSRSRNLAACAYGAASAAVAVLAVPRSLGFDRTVIELAFFALPVAAFIAATALRYVFARGDDARVVFPALAPTVAYLAWLLIARPTLAAPRNDRLTTLGIFGLFYLIATAFAFWLDRRAPRHSSKPDPWIEASAYVVLAVVLISWFGVRRPLFDELRAKPAGQVPDVLFIVLDTARGDMFEIGDPRIELPTLAKFSKTSRVYSSAYAASCWTLPSHASMFTGLPASATGALTGPLAPSIPTLAQRFARAGYATAGFSGTPVVGPSSGLNRGFKRFENFSSEEKLRGRDHIWLNAVVTSRSIHTRPLWQLRDDGGAIMMSHVIDYLDETTEPSFVFLNLFEPHDPYEPPYLPDAWATRNGFTPHELRTLHGEPYDELTAAWPPPGGAERYFKGMRLRYKGELWYVDHLLGELFRRLESAGRLDDTIIVVVSDHGENIGEHFPSLTHTLGLYETLTHVPLIVRYPKVVPAGRDARLFSTDRLHDMLLSLIGHEGADFAAFDARASDAVFSEFIPPPGLMALVEGIAGRKLPEYDRNLRGVRSELLRFVEASDRNHQAFDLRGDALEQKDLSAAPGAIPPAFQPLAAKLALRPQLSTEKGQISEELEKSLRALGYVQ